MIKQGTLQIKSPLVFIVLICLQLFCAVFFTGDVYADFQESGRQAIDAAMVIEALACIGLCTAIFIEYGYLMDLLQRKAHLEVALNTAKTAVNEVVFNLFDEWQLTPAEKDIATFMVKGYSTGEIAEFRGSAEGTVKAQLNSIYRKSGGRNRSEVLSIILDTLMGRDMEAAA